MQSNIWLWQITSAILWSEWIIQACMLYDRPPNYIITFQLVHWFKHSGKAYFIVYYVLTHSVLSPGNKMWLYSTHLIITLFYFRHNQGNFTRKKKRSFLCLIQAGTSASGSNITNTNYCHVKNLSLWQWQILKEQCHFCWEKTIPFKWSMYILRISTNVVEEF